VTLTEGDDVELVCTGWGWPVPYVIWTREDYFDHVYGVSDFGVSLRDKVTSHNITLRNAVLHIKNLNRSDQLNYLCTVANNFGYSNITIFVRVKGVSKQTCRIWFGFLMAIMINNYLDIINEAVSQCNSTVCAVLSSVRATTVDNSGVYEYYLKDIVSVYFRCPARTVGFSGTRLYLCIYNQPS